MRVPALWPRQLSLQSIRGRLALLLALAFLPAGVMAVQAGLSALAARDAAVQGEVGASALRRLSMARDEVTQLRETVRTLAASAELFADNRRQCQATLQRFADQLPARSFLSVLNVESVIQCANVAEARGDTAAGDLVLAAARRGDVVVGFVQAPLHTNEPVIAAVAPADLTVGSRDLFVGVTRPLRPLLTQTRLRAPMETRFVALIRRNGELQAAVGLDADSRDAALLSARLRQASAQALGSAFRLDDSWAVAMPFDEDARLYLVEGWTPASIEWAGYLRAGWALLMPIFLWLAAVGATWYAIELFVARPLLIVEDLARSYARGEDSDTEEALLHGAPVEISSLRRTLAAMAKTLRGREVRLATALQEERALLLEVNHRVKNNLQMVASILSIQARASVDAAEARGLSRAQDRIQLLALAHAHIYASGEVRDIALEQLAGEIAHALHSARGDETAHIRLELALAPARTSVARAVPVAFLIGETLSSILDFGAERVSRLCITLEPADARGFVLEINADAALEPGAAIPQTSLRLIGAFARQIDASVTQDPARPCFVRIEAGPAADIV